MVRIGNKKQPKTILKRYVNAAVTENEDFFIYATSPIRGVPGFIKASFFASIITPTDSVDKMAP